MYDFFEYANKVIRHLTYDHLFKLDSVSINLFHQTLLSSIDIEAIPNDWDDNKIADHLFEIRKEALPTIIENRRKLNTDDGYGIIDGSQEALSYLDYGTVTLQTAKRILLLSDGLQLPTNQDSGVAVWGSTAKFAFDNGLEALKEEVQRLEGADKLCVNYPRLKFADDKTGIMLRLS